MPAHTYTASLSQSQGRAGYSVIFRHPARKDDATGKVGVRVRRGLNTREQGEAERLRDQLNELLKESRYHEPAARAEAERRFDARVVEIFFDKMVPEEFDFAGLRDEVIRLPESGADGYRSVLLLGTTGAGKTTLVRQFIGTDPVTERFPSTSTAKTTVHDTEIVMDEGSWRAVVTFVSSDEAREYLNECISSAVLAASKGADDATVLRRLLSHVNQRFRFNYILGNGMAAKATDFDAEDDDEDPEEEPGLFADEELNEIDLAETNELLKEAVVRLRETATRLGDGLRKDLGAKGEQDERVIEELFEEKLDDLLHDDEAYHEIADALMDEIEKRFDLLPPGKVTRTKQGWPRIWTGEWSVEHRKEFLKAVARFSSNYAPFFGRLLTPLVNGVRVAGPFSPSWNGGTVPKLVLLDGEGMGHTPKSSSAVSTTVSRRIESADAVLLVDNATQPMQAAPLAAMREVVATGNARKLILAFTHFDEVKGDNLPNAAAKAQHVLASAENVLASFGEELGPFAERSLRRRLDEARFFLAGLQDPLSDETQTGKRTIKQLLKLLQAIDAVIERPQPSIACPIYDRMNLVLAIKSAAEGFHEGWLPRLGLKQSPGIIKEHWTRVKALTRRLATGMADEYDSLKPVADLRKELRDRIYVFVQNPLRWEGPDPTDDERQVAYDSLADNVSRRLLALASRRLWRERTDEWQSAYDKRGTGSTFVRARIIDEDIYESAAPVPDVTPSPDRNQFLRDVVAEVEAAATETGAQLI
jgi:hypothetical protein